MKTALAGLSSDLFDILHSKLKGKFGQNEIIKGIVMAYLSQQEYLKDEDPSKKWAYKREMVGAVSECFGKESIV